MKKISLLILILLVSIVLCGCDESTSSGTNSGTNLAGAKHYKCTRTGEIENGEGTFNYDVYSNENYIIYIKSIEKVTSSEASVLDEYEKAYKRIESYYVGLNGYEQDVIRKNDSVQNVTIIDYEKLDMKELIEIEGNENNLYENNKLKYSTWLEFAKKLGTKCIEVED